MSSGLEGEVQGQSGWIISIGGVAYRYARYAHRMEEMKEEEVDLFREARASTRRSCHPSRRSPARLDAVVEASPVRKARCVLLRIEHSGQGSVSHLAHWVEKKKHAQLRDNWKALPRKTCWV